MVVKMIIIGAVCFFIGLMLLVKDTYGNCKIGENTYYYSVMATGNDIFANLIAWLSKPFLIFMFE